MSRHPATEHLIRLLDPNPNLPEPLLSVAQDCAMLRDDILVRLPNDGPEISAGLRKLLEAKDCFVRQALLDQEADSSHKFKVGDVVELTTGQGSMLTGTITWVSETRVERVSGQVMYKVRTAFGEVLRSEDELRLRVQAASDD